MGCRHTLIGKAGMQNRKTGCLIVFSLLALCAAQAQGPHGCTVTAPRGWVQSSVRWDGPCPAGVADGLGVLKELGGGSVRRIFFGMVRGGEIRSGVIDQENGYIAGNFAQGSLLQSDDRQTVVSAFDQAAQAANQAAARFEKAGNRASAQFYRAKAKTLREQMD